MSRKERSQFFLEDMLEHAQLAQDFIADKREDDFANNRMLQFAVVREAAKAVPDEVRALAPSVPWRQMTGMRDKLIHRYFGVDAAIVRATVTLDMPKLIDEIRKLIIKLGSGTRE